ncbi:MAG: ArsR/SmtB family transcription factor [Acidimicrobiales bacterium]
MSTVTDDDFAEWADWFKCLADPSRLKILNFVSSQTEPLTVGDIVEFTGQSQSTVSHHLKILGTQRFVLTEADGVRTLVRRNELCMTELPLVAAAIMARSLEA